MPETETIDVVFGLHAEAMGIPRKQFQGFIESLTHRNSPPDVRIYWAHCEHPSLSNARPQNEKIAIDR
jgi:hypothetical protein